MSLRTAHAPRRSLGTLIVLLVAACSRGEAGSPADSARPDGATSTASTAAAPSAASSAPIDVCQLLPVADVSRVLEDSLKLRVVSTTSGAAGQCTYNSAPDDTASVRVLIEVATHPAAAQAVAALGAGRAMNAERQMPVADAPELGTGAFTVRDGATAGASYQVGRFHGRVNLGGGELPATDRQVAAARALAAEVRRRLEAQSGA